MAEAKAAVRSLFDHLASEYVAQREREFSFVSQKRLVLEMLSDARGRILEIGCGAGHTLPDLVDMGFEVDAIDLSEQMVARASEHVRRHRPGASCRVATGDIERLDFATAQFDAVLLMGVLEYLPSHAQAIAELARVLKPGGCAVIAVPNGASAYHVTRTMYRKVRRALGAASGQASAGNPCLPWQLDGDLTAAGMRKIECAACNFIFFPLKDRAPRLSDRINRLLTPAARLPAAPLLGAQYLAKFQKT
jgi:2-polyprenyl-3-methyl-5-hydroxy-6-metoxy-1,4-benzoquinol methylase